MKDELFLERYNHLNKGQKEAVDTIEGPVMVIAGPGTGKTTVLTLRIANILRQTDTPPDGILALTFTDSGVKAIREKLRQIMPTRADDVKIYTYHGFASSIMSEFPEYFPLKADSKQMSDVEAESIIREIIKDKIYSPLRPFGNEDMYIQSILSSIRESKKEAWTPEMLRQFAKDEKKRIEEDPASISSRGRTKGKLKADALNAMKKLEKTALLADVFESYEEKKKKGKKKDYEDLIYSLIQAFEEDEMLLRLIQEKYLYIHIDEHQDTNDSQNLIISKLADFFDIPNLFIVGDEKQAIYRFQGASVENFLAFETKWPGIKIISLDENYRSHQHILDASFSMIDNNYSEGEHERLRIRLKANSGGSLAPIKLIQAGNLEASEQYLVDNIERIGKEDSEATVAVIVRKNRDVERILALLKRRGIDASAERGADIFTHPIGRVFFDLINYLNDISNVESLARAIAGGLFKLSLGDRIELVRNIRSGQVEGLEDKLPELSELGDLLARGGAVEYLIRAGQLSGLEAKASRDPLSAEVWRMIIGLGGELARTNDADDPRELMSILLEYRMSGKRKVKIDSGSPDSKVSVITAHGSKGLEYDYVFMPYVTESAWIKGKQSNYFILPREESKVDEVKDERRLFYVALTRAKRDVFVISPLEDGSGRQAEPLRFINELDRSSVENLAIPPALPILSVENDISLELADKQDLADLARRQLYDKGLSVSALNDFVNCRSKYFFRSILKLPEPPSIPAEKGTAMHEAFAAVWRLKNRSEEAISGTIKAVVKDYLDRSLLPAFEKERVLEELLESAPIVSGFLFEHFAQKAEVLSEVWMETSIEDQESKREIRLYGKLDAVLDNNSHINVYDYKTTDKKSDNEIKGLTKNSDGHFFRQLIFYKMLLMNNPKYRDRQIDLSLVFVKPDERGVCSVVSLPVTESDVQRVESEIGELINHTDKGTLLDEDCDDRDCEFCSLKKALFA